jgi:ATP-binding cassette subfamily B protein/subfamily B ATP-binding cassette protein MsbA
MASFLRAVRRTLRYRYSLLAATVFSLLVGTLWGANIGAIYPFVEIVFQGESLQDSIASKLADAENRSDELKSEIAELRRQSGDKEGAELAALQRQIELKEERLRAERRGVATIRRSQPLVENYLPRDPFMTLALVIGAMTLGTLLKSLCLVGSEVLVARATHHTMYDLQNEFYQRTMQLDVTTFADDRTSLLLSSFTHRLQGVGGGLRTLFGQAVREPLKMAVCLGGAAMISWRLLILSLLIAPVGIVMLRMLTRAIKRGARDDMNLVTELYKRLSESFAGIVAVKVFTAEKHEELRFRAATERLLQRRKSLAVILSLTKPISELLGISIIAVAILSSSYLVLHRETHLLGIRISDQPLSPAALMLFYAMLAGVADPARKLSAIYGRLYMATVQSTAVFRLFDRQPRIADSPQPKPIPVPHRELTLEGVGFGYGRGKTVLRDIDLTIPFGEKLALVGPNGCGKSTLAKLILRLHDPKDGQICLDGIDLRDFHLRDLRQHISTVTQETWLFDDTIFNNICYGRLDASRADVLEASRKAHAHEFITRELPQAYETQVGERGCQLSGGQRQRVALARAILRDPAILILDEATSEIDAESEQLLHTALAEFFQGRTAIMITHRMSMLELADRIAVMDGGRILDAGTHADLLRRCEVYQRLHASPLDDAA